VTSPPGPPVKSASRTLDVLEDIAAHGSGSLHVLAGRLGLPKSSLHGILRTMLDRGWLVVDAGRYTLGIRSLLVGSAYLESDAVIGQTSQLLDELAEATVHLARLDGRDIVYLAKRESVHPLRMFSAVGRRLPAHATALGRALLADRPDRDAVALLRRSLVPITARTTTDRTALLVSIAAARDAGYAVEREESCLGVTCFAVALPLSRPAKDAISVAVPLTRLNDELRKLVVDHLLDARRQVAAGAQR